MSRLRRAVPAKPRTAVMRVSRNSAVRWLLELLSLLTIVIAVHLYVARGTASGPAPDFSGTYIDGGTVHLEALRGAPVLVHFWGTWCPVCRTELGSIDRLSRSHQVVTIAMQSGDDSKIAAYLRAHVVAFPVLNDRDGRLAARFGVRVVPATFIVGPRGNIRFVEVGYTTELGMRLRLWLAAH